MSFKETWVMCVGNILEVLDTREGLEVISLHRGNHTHIQQLIYQGIPFKCNWCHSYGNFSSDCSLPFKRKILREKNKERLTSMHI